MKKNGINNTIGSPFRIPGKPGFKQISREMGIKGKVFSDAGMIGKPDSYNPDETEYSRRIRVGVGTGILWSSPMGVINLDFTYPLVKTKFDKTRVFRLNFGKGF